MKVILQSAVKPRFAEPLFAAGLDVGTSSFS
jgi:hypothetical protein